MYDVDGSEVCTRFIACRPAVASFLLRSVSDPSSAMSFLHKLRP